MTKLSSSGAASSALAAFSVPIVETRAAPGGAEQNDPAPWVGHTAVASGSPARRRSDRYWARANSTVRSDVDEVGTGGRADDERPAGEHPDLVRPVQDEVRQVLRRVSGCGEGPQGQAAEVDLVAVGQTDVGELSLACGGGQDLRVVVGGELPGAGDEVGVQVGLRRVRDAQVPGLGLPGRSPVGRSDGSTASARPSPRSSR